MAKGGMSRDDFFERDTRRQFGLGVRYLVATRIWDKIQSWHDECASNAALAKELSCVSEDDVRRGIKRGQLSLESLILCLINSGKVWGNLPDLPPPDELVVVGYLAAFNYLSRRKRPTPATELRRVEDCIKSHDLSAVDFILLCGIYEVLHEWMGAQRRPEAEKAAAAKVIASAEERLCVSVEFPGRGDPGREVKHLQDLHKRWGLVLQKVVEALPFLDPVLRPEAP
jgi:hypothetical protein